MNAKKIISYAMALMLSVPMVTTGIISNDYSMISTYASEVDNDFEFSYDASLNATINKYLGSDVDVEIPSTVTNSKGEVCTVTEIIGSLFEDKVKLQSVTLPETLTSISYGAFKGCTSLQSVTIKEGSVLKTISNHAFNGCTSLTSIDLPNSLQDIGPRAFYGCTSLEEVTLPNSLTSISQEAFYGSGLTSIFIPDSVETLDSNAFTDCTSLKTVTIEDGSKVRFLTGVFKGCTSLTTVDLGTTIEDLSTELFAGCTSLTTIDIPKYIEIIYDSAFKDCTALKTVNFSDSVTEIWQSAFMNCTSLTDVTLPPNIKKISYFAFANCDSLKHIDIPTTTDSIFIREGAFAGCNSMYYIVIPQDSPTIETYALGYDYSKIEDDELIDPTPIKPFTIVGVVDSSANTYATDNDISFIDVSLNVLPDPPTDTPTKENNFVNGVYGDVNGDGKASTADLLILKKLLLGLI